MLEYLLTFLNFWNRTKMSRRSYIYIIWLKTYKIYTDQQREIHYAFYFNLPCFLVRQQLLSNSIRAMGQFNMEICFFFLLLHFFFFWWINVGIKILVCFLLDKETSILPTKCGINLTSSLYLYALIPYDEKVLFSPKYFVI